MYIFKINYRKRKIKNVMFKLVYFYITPVLLDSKWKMHKSVS